VVLAPDQDHTPGLIVTTLADEPAPIVTLLVLVLSIRLANGWSRKRVTMELREGRATGKEHR
jgi:hypothetical protein